MVCTRTLYNEVWAGNLDLSVTELPEAMKRKQHKDSKPREHKKSFGTDISQRPEIAALRIEEGHWEGDTVVGKRAGKEAVVLSLLEKKTENYIAIQIPGKDADSVLNAMQSLREEFGDKFSQVFKTITVDNGSEFSTFSLVENWGSAVYFAHPYTSWERPQNERHNGLFQAFVPKGASIESFSPEYILSAADELNGRPRKKLGYRTPEELFDEFLDSVYAASGCGPAFVYLFLDALANGGVSCGLPYPQALALAAQTMIGAAEMALASGKHPGKLQSEVCSPGGTTIAGVRTLEQRGARAAAMDAVIAAYERTCELAAH